MVIISLLITSDEEKNEGFSAGNLIISDYDKKELI